MSELRSAPTTALPPEESLSERQLRGADCVFCGESLRPGNVRDLGTRPVLVHGDTSAVWFARAHPNCLAPETPEQRAAWSAVLDHLFDCPACLARQQCPDASALRKAERALR